MAITMRITGGPSREELFDGLRLRAERRKVSFVMRYNETLTKTFEIIIDGLEVEDGSGQSWLVKAACRDDESIRLFGTGHLTIYYNTRNRTGTVTAS